MEEEDQKRVWEEVKDVAEFRTRSRESDRDGRERKWERDVEEVV